MTLVTWSDSYSTGIPQIDQQHQELVRLLNELYESILARQGSRACRAVVDRLFAYTQDHFRVEENMMRRLGYPRLEVHKAKHQSLLKHVVGLLAKLDAGNTAISFELLHFLKLWLTKHITESDRRFGAYASAREVSFA